MNLLRNIYKSIGISVNLIKVFDYQHASMGHMKVTWPEIMKWAPILVPRKCFESLIATVLCIFWEEKKVRRTLEKHNLINQCVIPQYSLSQCNGAIVTACDGTVTLGSRIELRPRVVVIVYWCVLNNKKVLFKHLKKKS